MTTHTRNFKPASSSLPGPGETPRSGASRRRPRLRRMLASVGATTMLAVAGFGVMTSTEAQAAGVKTQNYVVVQQPAVTNGESVWRDRDRL
ncbi:hypothetical protein [uncultured Kocuria sp.]|uniref:hypothetical protein n=1 Tax=uncultured Kocuria sp. TaxID=259305 RepID=UPI002597781F|nr:hypothetical protein [uncultured Kocuria sp.]MCT1367215.1 hypothetical protein [Rothia sp. p3-SID1597]